MNTRLVETKIHYQTAISIWEGFCLLHKELFNLTCDEYLILLESNIDQLESMLPLKEEVIQKIGELEKERTNFINELNSSGIFSSRIEKSIDLIKAFSEFENASPISALKNLNSLLIDVIHKIHINFRSGINGH